jgi:ligand-binding sensor domain-containing protein/serine phosphatase RsbU (regulator of sigma subunit)
MRYLLKLLLNSGRIKLLRSIPVIFIASFIFSPFTFSQNLRFKKFSVSEGLCHPFVYNISQDKNGFIWLGTGEGLCRYDGFSFISANTIDSLPIEVVNVCYSDSLDNLWIGFNNGELWSYDGNYFQKHEFYGKLSASITAITQDKEGAILVATQNRGIFKLSGKDKPAQLKPNFAEQTITSMYVKGNNLLVGSQDGLFILNMADENDTIAKQIETLSYIKIQSIKDAFDNNSFWIGTEDVGLFLLTISSDSVTATKVGVELGLGFENIQDITYDVDSNLWLSTFTSGLIKLKFKDLHKGLIGSVDKYNKNKGFATNFIKTTFEDREGNIWVGTYGNGFALLTNQALEFVSLNETGLGDNVLSLAKDDSIIWLGGENGLLQMNTSNFNSKFFGHGNGLPVDNITSLYYRNGILWVGTLNNGVYKHIVGSNKFSPFFSTDNSISNTINSLTGDGESLYIATKNGIFAINISSGQQFHYNTLNGLPHNNIEHLYLDSENRLLFATRTNGIYEVTEKGDVQEVFTVGKYELDFSSITEDYNGNIWAGTFGQGVFFVQNDTVINITIRDGLKSNYCYSIISADSQYVWVGHRLGMSRIDIHTMAVTLFDADNGITGDCNKNAVKIGVNNTLYFGTTDGLLTYNSELGSSVNQNPKANILKVWISDKEYDFRKPIILPYSAYKLRIEFIGLNYSNPKGVKYQYKLEGYDLEWSEVSDLRSVIYPRVEDGEYRFLLKAFGSNGATTEMTVSFNLKVKLPVWKTWWFISLLIIMIILSIIVIIKYRERKQKQIQEYLEHRLDERTREVVEQKEVIEIKNRDITDSINYAQRIQASILPPIKRLQLNFSGSFIFYQPRDIVSGDFYWFDRINDNKFIIVCADSTGHGVPGAFMSMIGTTLIKDICMREEINSPSAILSELDHELRATLNQNIEVEQSNDGMDIIVCEIDIRTNYLRYASAMRPMVVYRGGEQIYVKGSRSSVGGQYDKEDKIFKDEGIQLGKGDLIYMFSDGYPDQFGGSVGKKFKMVRLKNLLRDINQKPMEEQYEYVKSTFNLWREDFEQVDDVLFMGIKI